MTSWQPGRPQSPGMRPGAGSVQTAGSARMTPGRYNEDMEQLIFRMHQMLIEELDADQISAMPPDERRKVVEQAAETVLRREMPSVGGITRDQIVSRVVDEVVGLGPIDALMRDLTKEDRRNDIIKPGPPGQVAITGTISEIQEHFQTLTPPNTLETQLIADGHETRLRGFLAAATNQTALTCPADEFLARLRNWKIECVSRLALQVERDAELAHRMPRAFVDLVLAWKGKTA